MRVASLRLRFRAALIDSGTVIGGLVAILGLLIGAGLVSSRLRVSWTRSGDDAAPPDAELPESPIGEEPEPRGQPTESGAGKRLSRRLQVGVWTASVVLAVAGRNWRSPGARAVGLRRVDARTGGPVSVRSALVGFTYDQLRQAATRRLFGSRARRRRERLSSLEPRQTAIQRRFAGDPTGQQRALMDLYKETGVSPLDGCGWLLAGAYASQLIGVLGTRDARTIYDQVTGTVVIVEEASRSA